MIPTRRQFIKGIGIAIASLVMARCIPLRDEGDSTEGEDSSPQDCLRNCWLRLDWLAQQAQDREGFEQSDQARDGLIADHRAALDDLVAAGELDAAVADQMQVAFGEAAYHAWRNNAPITCYIALPMEYGARGDLLRQAEHLRTTASDLDSAVVDEVEAAIARDIAFFEAVDAGEVGPKLLEQFEANEIEASPEAIEAAHILVGLLLGRTD